MTKVITNEEEEAMTKTIVVHSKGKTYEVKVDKDLVLPEGRKIFKMNRYFCFKDKDNKNVRLHRWVLGLPDSNLLVDHIDNDPTNNTLSNLRVCTHTQNQMNIKHKGCSYRKDKRKWRARITVDKKTIDLGSYDTEEKANKAYQKAHKKYFKEFSPYHKEEN